MKKSNNEDALTPSANSVQSQPHNVFELINKYGTYNIQPTAESDNKYPKIAQGLSRRGISEFGYSPSAYRKRKTEKSKKK